MQLSDYINNNTLLIRVRTNAPKSLIKEWDPDRKILKVDIQAPPEKGKANLEIVKLFTKLTKKNVKIVSGLKSKTKLLKFTD